MKTISWQFVTNLVAALALVLPLQAAAAADAPSAADDGKAERWAGRSAKYVDDEIITARVTRALANVNGVQPADVQVEVKDGAVVLRGFVASQSAKDEAVLAARQVEGVRDLKDAMQVRPRD